MQTSTALTIVTAIVGAFGATAVYLHMAGKLHQAKVIMDLTIPGGMGGKEAVREILEIDPDAMVIVSSGYADDPVMADYADYGFQGVIIKPFTRIQLQNVLSLAWQPRTSRSVSSSS